MVPVTVSHPLRIVDGMDTANTTFGDTLAHLEHLDLATQTVDDLRLHVLSAQVLLDHVRVVHARVVAAADAAGVWSGSGHRSMAAWLATHGRTTFSDVRRQQRLAAVLNKSPEVAAAVADGRLSAAAAEAMLAAVETGNNVADLVEVCAGATPHDAAQAAAKWQELNPPPGQTAEDRIAERRKGRRLSFTANGDGTTRISGLVPTLEGRIIKNALEHLIGTPTEGDDRTFEQKLADALVALSDAYAKGEVTGGRQRPTIIVTIDLDALEGRVPGVGYTAQGDVIPADIVRSLVENAGLQRVLLADGLPVDVGREQRLATDAQYRALIARDGGCDFPACTAPPGWCDVDHIIEWEHGGETSLENLMLLCRYHHTFRHRPDVRLIGTDRNNLSLQLPDGTIINIPPARTAATKAA